MTEYRWQPSHKVETPPQLDAIPEYDPRSGDHCWLMLVGYQVYPERWIKGGQPVLDQENLVSIQGPGCYYCEQPYSPLIAQRRCPGQPKSG